MKERYSESNQEPQTAREAVKALLRQFVLLDWTFEEICTAFTQGGIGDWRIQMGGEIQDEEEPRPLYQQVAAIQAANSHWAIFSVAEIIAEIRREEAKAQAEEKHCLSCAKILPRSRRTRQYCNEACRVAAFRRRKVESDRAALLQQTELRGIWEQQHIEGELRTMLQDLLVEYGENAARVATNAVLLAKREQGEPQQTSPKRVRARPVPRTGSLPRELVSLVAFAKRHHVARENVARGIELHWITVVQGDWTAEDGTAITWALDAFGRYDFYEYFHHIPTFTPCNECPHALV